MSSLPGRRASAASRSLSWSSGSSTRRVQLGHAARRCRRCTRATSATGQVRLCTVPRGPSRDDHRSVVCPLWSNWRPSRMITRTRVSPSQATDTTGVPAAGEVDHAAGEHRLAAVRALLVQGGPDQRGDRLRDRPVRHPVRHLAGTVRAGTRRAPPSNGSPVPRVRRGPASRSGARPGSGPRHRPGTTNPPRRSPRRSAGGGRSVRPDSPGSARPPGRSRATGRAAPAPRPAGPAPAAAAGRAAGRAGSGTRRAPGPARPAPPVSAPAGRARQVAASRARRQAIGVMPDIVKAASTMSGLLPGKNSRAPGSSRTRAR